MALIRVGQWFRQEWRKLDVAQKLAIVLSLVGFGGAFFFYYGGYFSMDPHFACPICPHVDGIGISFLSLSVWHGAINGVLFALGGFFIIKIVQLARRLFH
ncbi:MAG TPA: hypothetical protein VGA40_08895 [Candidatus Acidoferrales bacterium]